MQDAKEEVRDRLAIEDVIGEYVQLKRAGRNLKGLSPFNDERTPSFMVSPEKQIWHDFSSGRGGDIYSFIMLVEGMDFRQALEHLARKAGVELSMFSKGDGRTAKRRARSREALNLATKFFQQTLVRTPEALEYVVKKRGFTRQTIADFSIGYAPDDGRAMVTALEKRGFSRQELTDAGLLNRFGGDLYRGRMTIALMDGGGEVVGFTGRIIKDEPNSPKYLNTPQTLLFDKSRHIFGLSQAKEAIRKSDTAVIVEGNLDVVSSHQAGVKNVVATAGTAMTEQHLKALSRLAGRIKLAFDGDKAGLAASERAIGLAQNVGLELEIVSLPSSAKDPDELIQQGVELWQRAIDKSKPAVEWVISQYSDREDLNSAEGKRKFSSKSLELIRSLKDPVEQEHYLQIISQKTGASLEALKTKLIKFDNQKTKKLPTKSVKNSDLPPVKPANELEDTLVGLAINAPQTRRWLPALKPEMIETEEAKQVINELQNNPDFDVDKLPQDLQIFEQYVKIVQLKSDNRYANWEPNSLPDEMARLVKQIITKYRDTKKQQLVTKLREAEGSGDEQVAENLRHDLNALIKESV